MAPDAHDAEKIYHHTFASAMIGFFRIEKYQ